MTDIDLLLHGIQQKLLETYNMKYINIEVQYITHTYIIRNANRYSTTPIQAYIGDILKQSNDIFAYLEMPIKSNGEIYVLCICKNEEKIARITFNAKIDSTTSQIICNLKDGLLPFTSVTLY